MEAIDMFTPIPRERWEAAAARVDQLTPAERRTMLIRAYLVAQGHAETGDAEPLQQWARSVVTTVHLRLDVPGYREAVDARPRRGAGEALDVEDVLRSLSPDYLDGGM